MTDVLSEGPLAAQIHLLLAHGAGAPMTSPFMEKIAGPSHRARLGRLAL
jgi:predicted alpha/beta-hydrolase family hydrolase